MKRFHSALICLGLAATAWSAEHEHGPGCPHRLLKKPGEIQWFGSGRDTDMAAMLPNDAQAIYDLAAEMGLRIKAQKIWHSQGVDMNSITANGAHPAPHWFPGAAIIHNMKGLSGILEIVFPGIHYHQQFVRDQNTAEESRIVYGHVAGHLDMYDSNPLFRNIKGDAMVYSAQLATKMSDMNRRIGKPVGEFYHRLLSLRGDYVTASFDTPEVLSRDEFSRPATVDYDGNKTRPTKSIAVAVTQSLPAESPAWERELAEMYEKSERHLQAMVQTKYMHEGWATFNQYWLTALLWPSSDANAKFAQLTASIRVPQVDNPYWLASEGFFNLWEKHILQPEVRDLPPREQYKTFITFVHEVIEKHPTDLTFLRYALDDDWIRRKQFYLYRKFDWTVDAKYHRPDMSGPPKYICISRDPKRVREMILHSTVHPYIRYPDLSVMQTLDEKTGTFLLKHTDHYALPLQRNQLPKALYQYAKLLRRPVAIDTFYSGMWNVPSLNQWGWFPQPQPASEAVQDFPIRVEVRPQGRLSVRPRVAVNARQKEALIAYREFLQKQLEDFLLSLSLSSAPETSETLHEAFGFSPLVRDRLDRILMASGGRDAHTAIEMSNVPTTAEAVTEFLTTARYRMSRLLDLVMKGQWPAKLTRSGNMSLHGVLPAVPSFSLDRSVINKRIRTSKKTRVDVRERSEDHGFSEMFPGVETDVADQPIPWWMPQEELATVEGAIQDEDLSLASGNPRGFNPLPGDTFSKKPQPGGSGGESGEEGEEGDEGDEGEEPGEEGEEGEGGTEPGQGGGGESYVEIPMADWMAILRQRLEFPNIRPVREGDIADEDESPEGWAQSPNGNMLPEETAQKVLELGIALDTIEKRKAGYKPSSAQQLFKKGLRAMSEEQIIVERSEPTPEPRDKAVVVWVSDMSGSMGGDPLKLMRTMIYNERALLKSEYKSLEEVFIVYHSDAIEVKTEKEFFTIDMSGGTDASPALVLALKILEERFSKSRFNRYVRHFSDGFDDPGPVMREAEKLIKEVDYLGYSHVSPEGGEMAGAPLSEAYENLSLKNPKRVGAAPLHEGILSVIETLKKFYGPRKN